MADLVTVENDDEVETVEDFGEAEVVEEVTGDDEIKEVAIRVLAEVGELAEDEELGAEALLDELAALTAAELSVMCRNGESN